MKFPQNKLEEPGREDHHPAQLSQREARRRLKVLVGLGELGKEEEALRLRKKLLLERLTQEPDRN